MCLTLATLEHNINKPYFAFQRAVSMTQFAGHLDVYLRVLYDYKYKGHDGIGLLYVSHVCYVSKSRR